MSVEFPLPRDAAMQHPPAAVALTALTTLVDARIVAVVAPAARGGADLAQDGVALEAEVGGGDGGEDGRRAPQLLQHRHPQRLLPHLPKGVAHRRLVSSIFFFNCF